MTRKDQAARAVRGVHAAVRALAVLVSALRTPRLGGPRVRMPRIRITPGRVLGATASVLLGIGGATLAAGGSYAYLNAVSPVGQSGAAVQAGTSSLTLQAVGGSEGTNIVMPSTVWNRMLPGDIVGQTVTVRNTGDTPLALSARISTASAWELRAQTGACPVTVVSGAALTTSSSPAIGTSLAAGGTRTLCIQAVLPASAPATAQGTTPGTVLTIDGTQVAG